MKLTNLSKGIIAASAITLASFSANATIIASSILEVTGFGLTVAGQDTTVQQPASWTLRNNATYDGQTANQQSVADLEFYNGLNANDGEFGDPAMVCAGTCPVSFTENNFAQGGLTLSETSDFASSDSYLFTNPLTVGTNASTRADIAVNGNANGQLHTAGSEIQNSINTEITFTLDAVAGNTISLFYTYTAQLIAEISNDWLNPTHDSTADSSYGLSFTLTRNDQPLFLDNNGLNNSIALNAFGLSENANANNEAGTNNTFGDSKAITLTGLESGEYKLVINHSTSASASHVPEPTTLAILGLGLLGLAGSYRRKS